MTMNEFLINDTPVKIWAKVLDPIAYRQIYNLGRFRSCSTIWRLCRTCTPG